MPIKQRLFVDSVELWGGMGKYGEFGGVVPETGVEPVHLAAADFKSATSTNFVTRARFRIGIVQNCSRFWPF